MINELYKRWKNIRNKKIDIYAYVQCYGLCTSPTRTYLYTVIDQQTILITKHDEILKA